MDKNERRICSYSSVLITLLTSSPKLLALREGGIIAHYWHFNLSELSFQMLFGLAYCLLLFYLNMYQGLRFAFFIERREYMRYWLCNTAVFIIAVLTGTIIHRAFFAAPKLPGGIWLGYFSRLGLSTILIFIIIKLVALMREGKRHESENQRLKTAYMAAELELLKEQMNPHFLFNSLSSLSGVIQEDPALAQKYVRELSNVFRYTIAHKKSNLVTLEEEMNMLRSFAQLIFMRLENAFEIHISVPELYLAQRLPHLSLQPLLENAVKHNAATAGKPLKVDVFIEDNKLLICNNLQAVSIAEDSNGIGLANLNERFKIMMDAEIDILKTENSFAVKLPLKT